MGFIQEKSGLQIIGKTIIIFFLLLSVQSLFSQREKVKGNKIVMTEEKTVEDFHTLEVSDQFEVTLEESNSNTIRIMADSNLQPHILVKVVDGVLKISSSREIKRAKSLLIKVSYAQELKKIIASHKSSIKTIVPLTSSSLIIEALDETELFLTLDVGKVETFVHNKSKTELHTKAKFAAFQVNEEAELTGIATLDSLNLDLYQKASVTLEGEVGSARIRVDSNSKLYGEKLNTSSIHLISEGESKTYILCNDMINITARSEAEIYLLGESKVEIEQFIDEAVLYKKPLEYKPSKFGF